MLQQVDKHTPEVLKESLHLAMAYHELFEPVQTCEECGDSHPVDAEDIVMTAGYFAEYLSGNFTNQIEEEKDKEESVNTSNN